MKKLLAGGLLAGVFGMSVAASAATSSISRPDGLVDLTDPVGDVAQGVASKDPSTILNEGDALRAFDNGSITDSKSRLIAQKAHVSVAYTFNEAKVVNAYTITFMNDSYDVEYRAPKAWTVYGSTNYIAESVDSDCSSGTWTLLATVTGETDWNKGECRFFTMDNSTAYRSYKIDIADNNGDGTWTVFGEMEYFNYSTQVTVTIPEVAGGSASGAGTYMNTDTITLTAVPDSGYVFLCWNGLPSGVDVTSPTVSFKSAFSLEVTPVFRLAGEVVRYVATNGSDENAGTEAAPLATVGKAVEQLAGAGGFVYVAPGEYQQTAQITVTNAIRIVGTGANPSQTTLRYKSNEYTYGKGARVLEMNHQNAKIANVTMSEGMSGVGSGNNEGGCVRLVAGVVSNCVIRNSYARQASNPLPQGGGVYLGGADALVTHCVISNCSTYANAGWIGAVGGGVHMKAGRIDNSLVIDCHTHSDISSPSAANVIGGIYMTGGEAVNCSVIACFGSRSGGIERTGGEVVNCVSFGCLKKIQVTDPESGAKEVVTTSSPFVGDASAFFFCASDATDTYSANCSLLDLTADAFNDYAHADFTPANGGPLYDGGQMPESYPAVDLAGNARVMGASIDIGAYEGLDSTFLIVGNPENYGAVSPVWGVHADLAGQITATAEEVVYTEDGKIRATCEGWALYVMEDGDEWRELTNGVGNVAEIDVPAGSSRLVWNYSREFKVTTAVVGSGAVTCDEWVSEGAETTPVVTPEPGWHVYGWIDAAGAKLEEDGTFTISNAADIVALLLPDGVTKPMQYVATDGDDANDGWTPQTPRLKVSSAVTKISGYGEYGGEVWIAEGLYNETAFIDISRPIRVQGVTGDPEDVVIARTGGTPARLFTLNSRDSLVASLVMSNGYYKGQVSGSGCYIDKNGGTVSNCVVRNCSISDGYGAFGTVYVRNLYGLVTHTVVENSTVSDENQYGGMKGAGIHLVDGARAENCLVRGCATTTLTPGEPSAPQSIGGIYAGASAKVKNCTVIGCRGTRTGGIHAESTASVVNCAVWGCDYAYPEGGEPASGAKAKDWSGTAAAFDHCATDNETAINDTCIAGLDDGDFRVTKHGVCVPVNGGRLFDAGLSVGGWTELSGMTDLGGSPRVMGKCIDIGCYEGRPSGLSVYLR